MPRSFGTIKLRYVEMFVSGIIMKVFYFVLSYISDDYIIGSKLR